MAPNSMITTTPSTAPIKLPIATAHFRLDVPDNATMESPIPDWWKNLNFKAVDVLNVTPFVVDTVNNKGHFIWEDKQNGVKTKALAWVINTARTMNPNIKIIAMQYYGTTALCTLQDEKEDVQETKIANYVKTVAEVIEEWTLDGYDVDYEWNSGKDEPEAGNMIPEAPEILKGIRDALDKLSEKLKRPLYVTISPATTSELTPEVTKSVNFVNVQTYSGGWRDDNTIEEWIKLGFSSKQLTYGMWPEWTAGKGRWEHSPTFHDAHEAYDKQALAGINSWQLKGAFSNAVQIANYKFLHNEANIKLPVTQADLAAMWDDKEAQEKVPWS